MDQGKDKGKRVGKETEEESRKKARVEEEEAVVAMEEDVEEEAVVVAMEEDVEESGAEREIASEACDYEMALQTELLEDLIREILVRLPAISLCRFRSVCKTWRDIFSRDPDFKDRLPGNKQNTFILQNSSRSSHEKKLYSMVYEDEAETPGIQVQEVPLQSGFSGCSVKSSCDGLVLITVQHPNDDAISASAIILNPFTRETKTIPLKRLQEGQEVWGIGYDHLNRCYKVVRAPASGKYSPVQVLSLETNSWKNTTTYTGFPYHIVFRNPVTANRCPHWIASNANRDTRERHIIYFDASEEDFRTVPLYRPKLLRIEEFLLVWGET
ncbi:hypothetical protein Tsubulata_013136 [Turnera subulata]|uniref:F-box domain-containing protein n=1 Tax=Turnera subulata TaxID=218843 RepID=A0A9Q0J6H8_9ROSI|nr:hypothetical protein Tsubulata_013136 [Turnera subulata]